MNETLGITILVLLIGVPYCINFARAISAVNSSTYSIKTALRFLGIFIPFLGMFMGFVS